MAECNQASGMWERLASDALHQDRAGAEAEAEAWRADTARLEAALLGEGQ